MKPVTIIILTVLLAKQVQAQGGGPDFYRWSVNLEVLTQTAGMYAESVRLPGIKTQFSGGKGLQLGAEYVYAAGKKGRVFQNFALMKHSSRKETGLGAATYLGYSYRIASAFVEGQAGIGYVQTTFREGRERQNNSGEFFSEKFKVAGITPTAAVGAGYYVSKKWKIYLRYYHHAQLHAELNPGGVRLHRSLNLGVGWGI